MIGPGFGLAIGSRDVRIVLTLLGVVLLGGIVIGLVL